MPSTVYRGDLAEVTFGHETGLHLTHGAFGGLTFSIGTVGDVSTITFGTATTGFFQGSSHLKYPRGMLAGSRMRVIGGGNYTADDTDKAHVYTIVDNYQNKLEVTPAMKSTAGSAAGDELIIEAMGTPTIDVGCLVANNADASDETVLTDQFVGLAATVGLPETTVEVKRSHVVGVGRDVVVQEAQSMKNEGGSLETMMHSARWLYYALGNEAIAVPNPTGAVEVADGSNAETIGMGDTYIGFANAVDLSGVAVGDYITVKDEDEVLTPYSEEPTTRVKWTGAQTQFHSTVKSEIRRVIAVDNTTNFKRLYVDDPFNFNHAAKNGNAGIQSIRKIVLADNNATGSPHFQTTPADWGDIQNMQKRVLFSMWRQPSFALETSMRTRNVDSYGTASRAGTQSQNAPGGANDSKQLTRIYKGCKVKDWELTADADAEVKMVINFDALMCYTDTGRLESGNNTGDRYTAHRMFENIANGPLERKAAGIAPNTEKPFFFYNGTITAFGQNLAQVTKFVLKGNNNLATYYSVGAMPKAESRNTTTGDSLEQVPFAGSRNPTLIAEGKVEYECDMEVIITDPLLYHEFRTNRSRDYDDPITLLLKKNGPGTNREEVRVIIDDYIIKEAPLQIPDDKTPIKTELKILPKHVKVVAYDAMLHC